MTKTKAQLKMTKRKVNPVSRKTPRARAPRSTFDGSNFNFKWYPSQTATLVNVASSVITLDCSNNSVAVAPQQIYSAGFAVTGLTQAYEEYKYQKCHIKWLPMVAPGVADAGSRISAAYFDNPETILNLIASASPALIGFVKNNRTCQSWNAWEPYTYRTPISKRKPWFDINTNTNYTLVDTIERSVQGLIVVVSESISAAVIIGQLTVEADVLVKGLSITTTT